MGCNLNQNDQPVQIRKGSLRQGKECGHLIVIKETIEGDRAGDGPLELYNSYLQEETDMKTFGG